MEQVLHSWQCYELRSSVTSFEKNLSCGGEAAAHIASSPGHFGGAMAGCIAIGLRAAADNFFFFLVMHEPMD